MGYRSDITCIMYAVKQTNETGAQEVVNAWLKQRIPDFKELNGLDLHSYFEFEKDKAVFQCEAWKWYPDYPEIKALEDMFKEFADTFCSEDAYAMEFIRFGEDWADVEAQRRGNYECRLDFHRTIYID